MSKIRGYCYTVNNYSDEEVSKIKSLNARYHVIGFERGENGTPHLQGFIYFENPRAFSGVKKLLPRAHIEAMRGTPPQASAYCRKDNEFWEIGECPNEANSVNLWSQVAEDIASGMSWENLLDKYPEYAIKYSGGFRSYYETKRPRHKYNLPSELYKWQAQLIDLVTNHQPDARSIIWIYDELGNSGKSSFSNHMMSNHNFKVFGNGKTADIALAWNGENVIFDYSRSQAEHLNYQVIEDIKNGRIFSGKYQSTTKFYASPHVICLANFLPNVEKLSKDRWQIYEMRSDKSILNIPV